MFYFAGLTWQDKIVTLRGKMAERKISWFVVTALDEIACRCRRALARLCVCARVMFVDQSDHDPTLVSPPLSH